MIPFRCPSCGYSAEADNTYAGRVVKCPKCKASLTIPPVDWPAEAQQIGNLLRSIDERLKKTERHTRSTAQCSGCMVVFFILLPIVVVIVWSLLASRVNL